MRLIYLLGLLAISFSSLAQAQLKTVVSPTFFFRQQVDVRPYAGRPYRVSARVKVAALAGDSSNANVFAVVLDTHKKYVKSSGTEFGRMRTRHRDGRWRTYTSHGKLPGTAGSLTLCGQVYLNGAFGFDDFTVEVETAKGRWQPLPLVNGDFNVAAADSVSGFPNGWRPITLVPGFSYRTVTEDAGSPGNRYLEITGKNVVQYGKNAPAGHTVAVNGIKVYYETYGSGEPLLLLHGNGQSISAFNGQIPELAKHYQVIAVDTRAQGQSTTNGQTLSYDLFAEDMSALLTALHIPAAHVVGWSDGGNTGLSLAQHHPQQVKKLVTMGANLWADTLAVTPATLKEVHQGKRMTTLLWPINKQARQVRPLMVLLLDYPHMKAADLASIAAPTLVLAGEHDLIQDAHTRLIAASLPHGQVQILPGLTHYAPRENPEVFNAAVLKFLQGQAEQPATRPAN
ncbi:alpha/beta hydrolase [Hymenobacter sp. BT770]|uniref:alpha/beta fold hydrolase n=1 Tax=Hymenobacter sp. BT770 TaxID=2886942 RepID=UPI001D1157DC|nr:alpha/beta hydrolase [Hymenobacter sp. BT770]MCC3154431.1 alpha/beta hydrolase [Hymenobacter sp. BT770]MDO3416302.1 alpha/beta hydrolase [Hymenobacter sp. BT770]